jgi:hypothetical protein
LLRLPMRLQEGVCKYLARTRFFRGSPGVFAAGSLSFFAPRVAPKFACVKASLRLVSSALTQSNFSAGCGGRKKKGNIHMKEFVLDILRQVFGLSKPREGSLIFTRYSYMKMTGYGLDVKTLVDVYRNGKEVKRGMIVKNFGKFHVGIVVKPDVNTDKFLLITCWKRAGW